MNFNFNDLSVYTYIHFHVLRFAIYSYFPCSTWTCLGTVINSSLFPLIFFPSIYPDFPIMHNAMIQPSKLGTHLQPLNPFRSSCLRNRWAICPSATSRSIFTLARVYYTQKFLLYRVDGWGRTNQFWRIILGREIKIVRVRSISVNVLYDTYGRSDLRNIMTTWTCCHDSKSARHKLGLHQH